MNAHEIGELLATCAAYNRRRTAPEDALAWHAVLHDIDLDDAQAAVTAHYRTSSDWIMPADIREHALAERRRRGVGSSEALGLPSRFEPDDGRAARAKAGVAACRAALAENGIGVPTEGVVLDPTNPARDAALRRARTERASA